MKGLAVGLLIVLFAFLLLFWPKIVFPAGFEGNVPSSYLLLVPLLFGSYYIGHDIVRHHTEGKKKKKDKQDA